MVEANPSVHDALKRATALMDCPLAIITVARLKAIKTVKQGILARGQKLSSIPNREIVSQAQTYLEEHPELIDQAAEAVRSYPGLRTLAEREVRARRRNRR